MCWPWHCCCLPSNVRPPPRLPAFARSRTLLTRCQPTASKHRSKSGYRLETVALSEKTYASKASSSEQFSTRIDAPSRLGRGQWTVDQIPAGRLIGPLVVLMLAPACESDYEISVEDIASWEQANGQIPLGAVVMARTGWGARWNSVSRYRNTDAKGSMHFPGYSRGCGPLPGRRTERSWPGHRTPNLDHGSAQKYWP